MEVSLELAILAHEYGYRKKTRKIYRVSDGKLIKNFITTTITDHKGKYYLAPELDDLQTWLRDTKLIIVLVSHIAALGMGDDPEPYFFTLIGHPRTLEDDEYYKTYEEALEKGLKYAIEIVKYSKN